MTTAGRRRTNANPETEPGSNNALTDDRYELWRMGDVLRGSTDSIVGIAYPG